MKSSYSYSYGYDEKYCYPNTNVLKNKCNIEDANKLMRYEREISNIMVEEVYRKVDKKKKIGLSFFFDIHKTLFGSIYEWAGKIRTVDIAKGTLFCRTFAIESELNRVFNELEQDNYLKGYSKTELCDKMAYYMSEINAIHPFREGNGRTQRLYMEILASKLGYFLDFSNVTEDEMIEASVESFNGHYEKMIEVFQKSLK